MTNAVTTTRIVRINGGQARIALAAFCIVVLVSCSATKKTADVEDGTEDMPATTANAKGIIAKGGATTSRKYVDPMVSAGTRQGQATNGVPAGGQANTAGLPEGAMPGQASPSISGLATQPTGVRAGSFSIFSSPTAPAPPPTQMGNGSTVPTDVTGSAQPSGHLNPASKSVFSAQPANCGADANGVALRC